VKNTGTEENAGEWNIWTGENAPWYVSLGMFALFCLLIWKGCRVDDHFRIIWGTMGATANFERLVGINYRRRNP
jgi:hypothetical protein